MPRICHPPILCLSPQKRIWTLVFRPFLSGLKRKGNLGKIMPQTTHRDNRTGLSFIAYALRPFPRLIFQRSINIRGVGIPTLSNRFKPLHESGQLHFLFHPEDEIEHKKQAEWVRRIVSCRQSWSTHTTPQNLVLAPLLLSSYEHGVTSIVIRLPTLELIFSSHVSFERHLQRRLTTTTIMEFEARDIGGGIRIPFLAGLKFSGCRTTCTHGRVTCASAGSESFLCRLRLPLLHIAADSSHKSGQPHTKLKRVPNFNP
ncbi:hypothetical protein TWF102_008649 [Orbilia oligospora]|uniref:Uncharacterized protein n=1 Tax=Orbilia oligospora TaxID=2813651 RepID=A0A7C8N9U3_ORBOL|nr:hypothetical protein TWF102_008649 [Orbilia oligospora]KAF3105277.1 hypothetical protein TWF103_006734 [Orbilia oligospora]KAF3124130.1 hypothetical protein TWF594_002117 [Orbilia oligospora]